MKNRITNNLNEISTTIFLFMKELIFFKLLLFNSKFSFQKNGVV